MFHSSALACSVSAFGWDVVTRVRLHACTRSGRTSIGQPRLLLTYSRVDSCQISDIKQRLFDYLRIGTLCGFERLQGWVEAATLVAYSPMPDCKLGEDLVVLDPIKED